MTVDLTATGSLRALLGGIVDYAGLFPPAGLNMETTVRNYARHLAADDAWMLGRLIVPAARLDEFEKHAGGLLPAGEGAEPWQLSALVAPDGLAADLERVAAFNEAHRRTGAGLAAIGTIELKAPSATAVEEALHAIPDELFPFFELEAAQDPRGIITVLTGSDAGAKVRTGGLEAEAYPSPEHLARFIAACATAGLPFKATAGLHHPLRHHSEPVGAKEFGFLNVFTAAALAAQKGLAEADLVAVLTDESIGSFLFDEAALRYGDHELTLEQIDGSRLKLAISFGSCSFDEPLDHLRAMKLL